MTTAKKIRALLTPGERKSAVFLMGLMVIGMVLETLGLGLVIPAIALLTQQNLGASYPVLQPMLRMLGNPSQHALIVGGMLTLVAVYLIKSVFLGFLVWRQTRFVYEVQAQLSNQLFAIYLRQPYTFHLQRNSAELTRNIITEVNQFAGNAVSPAMTLITESLVLLGIAALLLRVEPMGAMIVVVVLGVIAWIFHRSTRARVFRWGQARQYHEGLRMQHLNQGMGGAKDVKLLGRESDFIAQYGLHTTQSARVGQFHATLQQFPRLWLELLAVIGLAILVLTMLARGREMASIVPTLGLFAAAGFRLMPSLNRLLSSVQSIRYGLPVVNILYDELQLAVPEPTRRASGTTPFNEEISITDLAYRYPEAPGLALEGVSLRIRKGESIGFVGPSGSGKSTLVDVVMGLLTPTDGEVAVDGVDIQGNLRAWQDRMGYVPQSIFLTDDTLRRNVAFGLADQQIDDTAVKRAITAAQLDELVAELPAGLETIVGERGIRLSGGQRQRIGIARALYHDPSVLVLDEATSALDTATEQGVMQAVRELKGGKTIIIVAHRLSTVQHCDRLFRLEQGRVVDEGPPEDMVRHARGTSDART